VSNVKEIIKQWEIDVREYRVRSTSFIERIIGGIMSEERVSAKLHNSSDQTINGDRMNSVAVNFF
jgi:hypothetical protein